MNVRLSISCVLASLVLALSGCADEDSPRLVQDEVAEGVEALEGKAFAAGTVVRVIASAALYDDPGASPVERVSPGSRGKIVSSDVVHSKQRIRLGDKSGWILVRKLEDAGGGKVVFSEDFDDLPDGERWHEMEDARVEAGCGAGGGKCLRVTYRPDSRGTPVQQTSIPIPPAKEYSLTYDLRFDDGFEFVKGGKLPGLSPTKKSTGCVDIESDAWSARLMWQREGGLKPYLYDQSKRDGDCGRGDLAVVDGAPFRFRSGRYYAITVHVLVNDPGESNGSVELFVDGQLGIRMDEIRFRESASEGSGITRVLFSTFFGGHDSSWSPSKEVSASFDNFEVHPGAFVRGPR